MGSLKRRITKPATHSKGQFNVDKKYNSKLSSIDINQWYYCNRMKPPKKGKYMLCYSYKKYLGQLVFQSEGVDTSYDVLSVQNYTDIAIAKWNGHKWLIDDEDKAIEWKYITDNSIKEYKKREI